MRCPNCQDQAVQILNFKPDKGLDPRMQMWACTAFRCDTDFYVVPKRIDEKVGDNVGSQCLTPVT